MTARKRVGLSGSQFEISTDEGVNVGTSNVVGRVKATDWTSREFQVPKRPRLIRSSFGVHRHAGKETPRPTLPRLFKTRNLHLVAHLFEIVSALFLMTWNAWKVMA